MWHLMSTSPLLKGVDDKVNIFVVKAQTNKSD